MENIARLSWMSMKEKQIFSYHFPPAMLTHSNNSWEETAFAKDMRAGILGGCMWPPRFYSCTFCEREFKSAQALGGHMNVHRRDRARLKQYPHSQYCEANGKGNHRQLGCNKSFPIQLSTKVGSLDHELLSTPYSSSGPNIFISSNVKALSTMEHFKTSPYSSTSLREQHKKPCFNSQTDENDGLVKLLLTPTLSELQEVRGTHEETGDPVETNLSVALITSVDKTNPTIEVTIPHKRHRITVPSLPDFVMSSRSSTGYLRLPSPDVILGVTPPAGIEDLDLELRLGDLQRVL